MRTNNLYMISGAAKQTAFTSWPPWTSNLLISSFYLFVSLHVLTVLSTLCFSEGVLFPLLLCLSFSAFSSACIALKLHCWDVLSYGISLSLTGSAGTVWTSSRWRYNWRWRQLVPPRSQDPCSHSPHRRRRGPRTARASCWSVGVCFPTGVWGQVSVMAWLMRTGRALAWTAPREPRRPFCSGMRWTETTARCPGDLALRW